MIRATGKRCTNPTINACEGGRLVRQIAMADLDSLFRCVGKGTSFGQYRDELRARRLDKRGFQFSGVQSGYSLKGAGELADLPFMTSRTVDGAFF
jgi:hypothetical protein